MTSKAIDYAEQTLGVHETYNLARRARGDLDDVFTQLSEAKDIKRDTEFRLTDREMELMSDEHGKHPDMSATAMKEHVKAAYWADPHWRELREQIGKTQDDISGLEYDERIAKADLEISVARLYELGGYLQYLAAVKLATNRIQEVPIVPT